MYYLCSLLVATLVLCTAHYTTSAREKTITGTIYSNNNASLYVNGKLVAVDPVPVAPHNAFNVSFQVPIDQDITFAIEAIDIADDDTGLELNNRCLGAGGLRAMFSNGVVTNSSWKCHTWHYGPVNWKQCFAAEERAAALKVLPACSWGKGSNRDASPACRPSRTVGPTQILTIVDGSTPLNGMTTM